MNKDQLNFDELIGIIHLNKEKTKTTDKSENYPIVEELQSLLNSEQGLPLKNAIKDAIRQAGIFQIANLRDYYKFLNRFVTLIPDNINVNQYMNQFYWIIDFVLKNNDVTDALKQEYQNWSHQFTDAWGEFLDTPASAKHLDQFYSNPIYTISDYYQGPSGWLTFNQFFAREIRPGKRPIDDPCNPNIIVSAADSVFKGKWDIDNDGTIKVDKEKVIAKKKSFYTVDELLDVKNIDHQYACQDFDENGKRLKIEDIAKRFYGGVLIHSFLNTNDYHRFHVPVGGEIVDVYNIHGNVYLRVYKNEDGSLGSDEDKLGWQFKQERGLIIIKSEIGYVAVLPVGMCEISSVVLTPQTSTKDNKTILAKGDEFGWFAFGGSDVIILFEADMVKKGLNITAEKGTHYLQGEKIAQMNK